MCYWPPHWGCWPEGPHWTPPVQPGPPSPQQQQPPLPRSEGSGLLTGSRQDNHGMESSTSTTPKHYNNKQVQNGERKRNKNVIYLGSYRGGSWSLCWRQRPPWGRGWAARHQQAAQAVCSHDSYRCCTWHLGWPAWRSRYAACNMNCRCSGHPGPVKERKIIMFIHVEQLHSVWQD